MRLPPLVGHVAEKDVRGVLRMQWIDLGVRRLCEVLVLIALDRLVEKRYPDQENQRESDPQSACRGSGPLAPGLY
jgi:hypothetical protein